MAPQKLEAALLSCPEVADCAVFGVPDAVSGKLPHAIIVPKTNNVDSNVFLRFFRGRFLCLSPNTLKVGAINDVSAYVPTVLRCVLRLLVQSILIWGLLYGSWW